MRCFLLIMLSDIIHSWFSCSWFHETHLVVSYRVVSLSLGQLYECCNPSDATDRNLGLFLLTPWKSNYIHNTAWDKISYSFPNFNGAAVEIWEWISNFIQHYIMDVITLACWDLSWPVLIKGAKIWRKCLKCSITNPKQGTTKYETGAWFS